MILFKRRVICLSKYRTFIPVMESNEQDGFVITTSTGTNVYPAFRAFDGLVDTYFRSSISPVMPSYLTISFPQTFLIGRYKIYLGHNSSSYIMKTWDFEGLVGGEWIVLHSGENPSQE